MSRLLRLLATFALLVAAAALTAGPALARKHDNDRMPDRWEKRHHLNVKKDDSRRDPDHDGLSNYGEYRAHTNPRKKDSDHDGRRDGREDFDRDHLSNAAEIRTGFDPGKADSDHDGVKDGREHAGKIVKLSTSSVTIALAVGGKLTAALGSDLTVDCPTPASGSPAGDSGDSTDPGDDADVPDPSEANEDAPLPADDSTAGDDGEDTGDAPDEDGPLVAKASQSEDDAGDGDATFNDDFPSGASDDIGCSGGNTLKVGAVVHKAQLTTAGSGPVVVGIELFVKGR
jgi:hypothetical protein